ncbi:uncharacterized protein F4807DRAFT_434567 [Annulohypoxylon truncatum]|uniref:uncharacterized protein n=1 Tax=Annulohypoxylon truncatum TaxID=327061 RepID=UPI002008480C|nr:uncharacterized protein F4807DRAFT_434567 [Annulohypoxylon truncatum]KAI1207434.1 hypothetical protein F4807DRAFT_434567 [Annulohypoxylon truncatum]
MQLESFLGAGATLVTVASVFTIIRVASDKWHARRLYIDDHFSIVADIFLIATFATLYRLLKAAIDPTSSLYYVSQLQVAMVFLTGFSMWTAKAPVLLLYIRLFGLHKWMRLSCLATLAVMALVILIGDAYNAAKCMPQDITSPGYIEYVTNCNRVGSTVGVICGFVGVFSDAVIFCLPLPILAKLHLPLAKKLGLSVVFLVGALAIVTSAVALKYKWDSLSGEATDIMLASTLSVIENTVVIIVGCVPATNALWSKLAADTWLRSKIDTLFSQVSHILTTRKSTGSDQTARQQSSEQNSSVIHLHDDVGYPGSRNGRPTTAFGERKDAQSNTVISLEDMARSR